MEVLSAKGPRPPIEEIYRIAKRYSRRHDEADDLVQDLFLEAVRTGRDFSDARFMAWGHGFLRNRAAFIARTEGRRRKREEKFHDDNENSCDTWRQLPERFIVGLRPSLRIIARLANCGLNRKEIRYLLAIADTALRQRITILRREWLTYADDTGCRLEFGADHSGILLNGLLRRSLTQAFRHSSDHKGNISDRIVGCHDPDGHLFTIRFVSAHKNNAIGNKSH